MSVYFPAEQLWLNLSFVYSIALCLVVVTLEFMKVVYIIHRSSNRKKYTSVERESYGLSPPMLSYHSTFFLIEKQNIPKRAHI